MTKFTYIFLSFSVLFAACRNSSKPQQTPRETTENEQQFQALKIEAREDSLELVKAYEAQNKIEWSIKPSLETKAIKAQSEEDAADDPAIWVHPTDPAQSLVFGSNKQGGLAAYNLDGEEIAYYPIGNINNVDVLYQYPVGQGTKTILGCTNRSSQSINLFEIDKKTGKLTDIALDSLKTDTTLIDDIYGFCFAYDKKAQKHYAIINGKNGLMQQFEMYNKTGKTGLQLSRSIQFDSQTEGMVADTDSGYLYVGEEAKGIWKMPIAADSQEKKTFIAMSDETNPNISYDVEGLTIYKKGQKAYLIASSQGNFSYAIFDLTDNDRYIKSFKISTEGHIDGAEETDGLDIVSDSLNNAFPAGLLVVQDGFNFDKKNLKPQNFKYVEVQQLINGLKE